MSIADISEERLGGPSERGNERTPPHDLLAEQSTLGGMLLSADAVADVVESMGDCGDIGDTESELDAGDREVSCRVNLDGGAAECAVVMPWVSWFFDEKQVDAQRRVEGERTVNVGHKEGQFEQTGSIHPAMVSPGTDILGLGDRG